MFLLINNFYQLFNQMWRIIFLIFLLTQFNALKLKEVYDVIIIGAGMSGLQASRTLTKYKVQHLILESRDRIGGRIHNVPFAGINVDLGAQYVHAKSKQALKVIMEDLEWEAHQTNQDEHFLYEGHGQLDSDTQDHAKDLHDKLLERTVHNAYSSIHDVSVKEAGKSFYQYVISKKDAKVRDMVKWLSEIEANNQGADINQLSGRQVDDDDTLQYAPKGGYSKFIEELRSRSKGKLLLNSRVVKIDYSHKIVKLTTSDGRHYYTKRVISSLPLGVLRHNLVKFEPTLPEKYEKLINKIGVGNLNKLFVSFQKPFWGDYKGWINFITAETEKNRYPVAVVVRDGEGKYILDFFIAGKGSRAIQNMSTQELKNDVKKNMELFFPNKDIRIKDLIVSKWNTDKNSLGSYSFYKVGTTQEDMISIRHPIENKIWFVGEHTHPTLSSMTQGAYQTGQWAAEEVAESLGHYEDEDDYDEDEDDEEQDSDENSSDDSEDDEDE